MTTDPVIAVFHLTTPAEWACAQDSGHLEPPSLAGEGFIHCSTAEQLVGTIERHFSDAAELLLLELEPALAGELRWEESRPGHVYPHLYRPLAVTEVARVHAWRREQDGSVALPAELT